MIYRIRESPSAHNAEGLFDILNSMYSFCLADEGQNAECGSGQHAEPQCGAMTVTGLGDGRAVRQSEGQNGGKTDVIAPLIAVALFGENLQSILSVF